MHNASVLREKLAKVEELFKRAGSPGERVAAGVARDRLLKRLADDLDPVRIEQELQISLSDRWSVRLFCAVCRKHGIRPYRYKRQRRTTVMVRVVQPFFDDIVWSEFQNLQNQLLSYFESVTDDLISRNFNRNEMDMPARW